MILSLPPVQRAAVKSKIGLQVITPEPLKFRDEISVDFPRFPVGVDGPG